MYEPFGTNYVWNLAANLALVMGGQIAEVEEVSRGLRDRSTLPDRDGDHSFYEAWCALGDKLMRHGEEAQHQNRNLTAAEKFLRATAYYIIAERSESPHFQQRMEGYRKLLRAMDCAINAGALNVEKVEVPYAGRSYPALFVSGDGEGPRPCLMFANGLDGVKEMVYLNGFPEAMARRGVSTLILDHPGVGGALRLHGMAAPYQAEYWASSAVDYLETRGDVMSDKIGIVGWSLGGYYAPRAAAFEKRLKLCAVWGANHNYGEVLLQRLKQQGKLSVPHFWNHVMWVFGCESMDKLKELIPNLTLEGIVDRITVPFLVTHNADDRQIPVKYAYESYEQAVNSTKREIKIFDADEGGVAHCGIDNIEPIRSYVADWVSETFTSHV